MSGALRTTVWRPATVRSAAHRALAVGVGCLATAWTACGDLSGTTNRVPLAFWDAAARGTVGYGYRDNIVRSGLAPESSAFYNASADLSLIRLCEDGRFVSLFFLFDDQQYVSAPSVEYERFVSSTLQGETPFGDRMKAGAELSVLYLHQVVDLTEIEAERARLLVDGTSGSLRPYCSCAIFDGWRVQLDAPLSRQLYGGDLSDYWSAAAGFRLLHSYGYKSELALYGLSKRVWYDTREESDREGVAVAGTELVYQQYEAGTQLRHYFDKEQHWRATTKIIWLASADSGSGYFDYRRAQAAQLVRWKTARWEIKAGVRLSWYEYPQQESDGEQYGRRSALAELRAERRLGEHWLLFASAEREWCRSNDPMDQYEDWTVMAGLGVDFD